MGLLWEKLWHRDHEQEDEILSDKQKKKRKAAARKRPIEEKESYKWIEVIQEVEQLLKSAAPERLAKIIHVFDREGDMAEVFDEVSKISNTGVVVRAAHNRIIAEENSHLREWLLSKPINMEVAVELPKTQKRQERIASLAIRYTPVKLRNPARIQGQEYIEVYGVYAV
ncbi:MULTISPECIES: hypothetical protein [unclassified Coleofasciculus]|uniref:hypothetical protein n=1 Tax=unclassified Coleofasciculus TaxID=2692782 RepID=UPI00187EBFD4|nr:MULTISPECIES: hypothetical protein [unclassified Coleofasciculus]MBE9128303.1 hypothetical protein [Coleofasciculus sp. LEGE 07081]MBE9149865.1 hypothetical protein [Coleofasciculus sp. LEGE 07092]